MKHQTENGHAVKIRLHAAADSNGKVIWPEVIVDGYAVESIGALRDLLGRGAGIRWSLCSWAGNTDISADDPRVAQDGFLLRLGNAGIRNGIKVECMVVA